VIRVEIQKANSYQLGRTHGHHRQQGKTVIDGTTQRKGGTITLLDEGRKLALARGRCSRRVKRQRWIDGLLRSDRVAEALPLLLRLGEFADRLGYRDVCATALLNAAIILAQTRRSMLGHASSRCGPCRCSI
jgi:hypothetical protein